MVPHLKSHLAALIFPQSFGQPATNLNPTLDTMSYAISGVSVDPDTLSGLPPLSSFVPLPNQSMHQPVNSSSVNAVYSDSLVSQSVEYSKAPII